MYAVACLPAPSDKWDPSERQFRARGSLEGRENPKMLSTRRAERDGEMLTSKAIPFKEPKTKRPIGKTERVRPGMTIRSGFVWVASAAATTKECEDAAGEGDSGGETIDPGADGIVTLARSPEAVKRPNEGTELTSRVGFGTLAREVAASLGEGGAENSAPSPALLVVDDEGSATATSVLVAEAGEDRTARTNRCLLAGKVTASDSAWPLPGANSRRPCESSRCFCVECVVYREHGRSFEQANGGRCLLAQTS